jgi:SAM-dependent methyltransferase
MDSTRPTTEMDSLKARLRATWTAGDFGQIAKSYEHGARDFVATLGLRRGDQVLDVACGTGNVAIPAARAAALVTGIDIAPNLIEQAIVKNDAEGLTAEFDIGDAEAMPYDDNSFDVVVTMFGGMFTPRPDVLSAELGRVCRQGGTIAMANWTPEGFIGQMFRVTGEHVTPPAGMPSPLLWGSEGTARERLADHVTNLEMTRQNILFTFPFGPVDVVECFRMYYGPTQKAFEALDRAGQRRLRNDLESLWTVHNQATDGTTMVESEYLEVRAVRA